MTSSRVPDADHLPCDLTLEPTNRLTFGRFDESYLQASFDLDNDPEVMRFINKGQKMSWEEYQEKFPVWLDMIRSQERRRLGTWPAHLGMNDDFVGWFSLKKSILFKNEIEIGYRLKRKFWNQGYAMEGAKHLLDYTFESLKLAKVISHTLAENARSVRVMEKADMKLESHFKYPEEFVPMFEDGERDARKYSLHLSEWKGLQAGP